MQQALANQPPSAKAIFVDGPSANKMKAALGIGTVNFQGLYKVLLNQVGNCRRLAEPPIVTVHPELLARSSHLGKELSGAGFKVLAVRSEESEDDAVIRSRIEALDPERVAEIAIVATDRDFVPELRHKASEGIRIHWVSTTHAQPGRQRHSVSNDVLDLCREGVFNFVELGRYTGQITKSAEHRVLGCGRRATDTRSRFEVVLNDLDPKRHLELLSDIQRLASKYRGLKFTVTE